jgi:hypothetical protein
VILVFVLAVSQEKKRTKSRNARRRVEVVRHFINGSTMRKMDTVCFDKFLHCAMLRIAPVEMTV